MSLITFREARPWTRAIHEKVTTREMPPWHADRRYGVFRNDLSLTQAEIDTIAAWVTGGAREGDPTDLPPLPALTEGWQIGTPDMVFEMPVDYEVPTTGTVEYQYFDVPTNFTEDRWMQAGEARPGDRAHVHHIVVYVREPEPNTRPRVVSVRPILPEGQRPSPQALRALAARAGQRPVGGGDAMLVNWAVGEDAPVYLPGTAKRIPAGSTLVFQMHYTTDGEPGVDRSKLGLIFAKQPPAREIRTGMILNPVFELPPGAANHEVEAEATFSADVNVWTMHPHMHLRGKDMTYTVTYPDGRSEIVLRVPRFDFGWQTDYWLAEPLLLPRGVEDARQRPLRQLGGQPRESRPDRDGSLGRPDVGGDDDRLLHVHGGGTGRGTQPRPVAAPGRRRCIRRRPATSLTRRPGPRVPDPLSRVETPGVRVDAALAATRAQACSAGFRIQARMRSASAGFSRVCAAQE